MTIGRGICPAPGGLEHEHHVLRLRVRSRDPSPDGRFLYSPPLLNNTNGALDPLTGRLLFTFEGGQYSRRSFSHGRRHHHDGDRTLIVSSGSRLAAYDWRTGARRWLKVSNITSAPINSGVAVGRGRFFLAGSGGLAGYNLTQSPEGARIRPLWLTDEVDFSLSSTPAVSGCNRRVFTSVHQSNGQCRLLAFNASSGAKLWDWEKPGVGGGCQVTAPRNGTSVVIRSANDLYVLQAESGEVQWSHVGSPNALQQYDPVVTREGLILTTDFDKVVALR
jgi:outer membrane protein assembly factor BamB